MSNGRRFSRKPPKKDKKVAAITGLLTQCGRCSYGKCPKCGEQLKSYHRLCGHLLDDDTPEKSGSLAGCPSCGFEGEVAEGPLTIMFEVKEANRVHPCERDDWPLILDNGSVVTVDGEMIWHRPTPPPPGQYESGYEISGWEAVN